jgi:hypothetical protein
MDPFAPSPDRYGPVVAKLLADAHPADSRLPETRLPEPRLPELGPGQPVADVRDQLLELNNQQLFDSADVQHPMMADCCRAGLWLWFDYLDESHAISQKIPTSSGSFWHGIMHRRELDYGNAKYWFRRAGSHPIHAALAAVAPAIAESHGIAHSSVLGPNHSWDAARFVDLCEQSYRQQNALESMCRELAKIEWLLLFDYCYVEATG